MKICSENLANALGSARSILPSESVYDSLCPDETRRGFSIPPKKPMLRDDELFGMQLMNTIDMAHPVMKLAGLIDWSRFNGTSGRFSTQIGRPTIADTADAGTAPAQPAWKKAWDQAASILRVGEPPGNARCVATHPRPRHKQAMRRVRKMRT